jgi:hypothetical protein
MKAPVIDYGTSCGRTFLTIGGYVVAMEGDLLRDPELADLDSDSRYYVGAEPRWTGTLIKFVACLGNPQVNLLKDIEKP